MEPIVLALIVAGYIVVFVIAMGFLDKVFGGSNNTLYALLWPVTLACGILVCIIMGLYKIGELLGRLFN